MSKNQKRTIAIAIIAAAVFTIIAFAIPFKRNAVFVISYIFGLAAIAIQLYVMKSAFVGQNSVKSRFYGFPIAQVGLVYLAIQLVLSILFMALAAIVPAWIPVVVFLLVFAFAAVGFIGADAMRDEILRQDEKTLTNTSCMTTLRSIVYPLAGKCTDPEAKKALTKLADEFKYSDPVSDETMEAIENELETAVSELQDAVENNTAVLENCKKVSGLLTERNRLCKLSKRNV